MLSCSPSFLSRQNSHLSSTLLSLAASLAGFLALWDTISCDFDWSTSNYQQTNGTLSINQTQLVFLLVFPLAHFCVFLRYRIGSR